MTEPECNIESVKKWSAKFRAEMDEQLELMLKLNPALDVQIAKENLLLDKMATIFIGSVELGRQIRALQEQVNALQSKT